MGFKAELLQVALVSLGVLDAWEGVEVAGAADWPLTCSDISRKVWAGHACDVADEGTNWTGLLQW